MVRARRRKSERGAHPTRELLLATTVESRTAMYTESFVATQTSGKAATAEFLQQWAPGRLPDTTDIAALLIGAALVQAAPPPRLHT